MFSPVNWTFFCSLSLVFGPIVSQIASTWIIIMMLNGLTLTQGFTLPVTSTTEKPINSDHDSRHLPRGWFGSIPVEDDEVYPENVNSDNIDGKVDQTAFPVNSFDHHPAIEAVTLPSVSNKDTSISSVDLNQPKNSLRTSTPSTNVPSQSPSSSSTSTLPTFLQSVSTPSSSTTSSPQSIPLASLSTQKGDSSPKNLETTKLGNNTYEINQRQGNPETESVGGGKGNENEFKLDKGGSSGSKDGGESGGGGGGGWESVSNSMGKHLCACKNESISIWDRVEISCKCFGESVVEIPNYLTKGVSKLSMISTGITVIPRNAFGAYSASLQDLYFESVKRLEHIEPGAFLNLPLLRTVYIKQAPLLKHIPDGVFIGNFPKFQVLKIIHSGLEVLPSMRYFQTKGIISILDFDSNRLKNISSASIRVNASNMILDYNSIERVHSFAFAGSHIAKLSLKGNRRLITIDDEAFVDLKNLAKLDLSETSITRLPTKGLEEVEVIKIVDTFTLKVFPSVFNFKNLKEAQLTYPYHCCAFKFPTIHDSKESDSRRYEERRNCRQGITDNPIVSTPLHTSTSATSTATITTTTTMTTLLPTSYSSDGQQRQHYPGHRTATEVNKQNNVQHQQQNLIFDYASQSNSYLIASYVKFIGDELIHYSRRLNSLLSDNHFIRSINSQQNFDSSSTSEPLDTLDDDDTISDVKYNGAEHSTRKRDIVKEDEEEDEDEYEEEEEDSVVNGDNKGNEMINHSREDTSWNNNSLSIINSYNSGYNGELTSQNPLLDSTIYGKLVVSPSDGLANKLNTTSSPLEILAGALGPQPPGFGPVQPHVFEMPVEGKTKQITEGDFIGQFHPKTASVPEKPIHAFCGEYAQIFRDIKCSPEPDAFNPCEDVMGNLLLRIADWIISIAAIFGNLAVMLVLMSSRFSMSVSKFLMCNLAFADFLMGVYLLIIAIIDVHTIGRYFNFAIDWQHGLGCMITGFITVFASELSIITLTLITLERWYAITYAIHLNRRLKLNFAIKVMIGGWIYSILMASLPLFGISGYSKTSICLPMENKDLVDITYLTLLLSINALAFVLISACYGKMYLAIASQRARIATSDKTIAKRMALLVFTDFACWAPIAFFGLTAIAGYPLINLTNSKILLVFFYPLNSCANPFLYVILTKQYRRDFFILASRYGLCTKNAARYKGTSGDCKHHRKKSVNGCRFNRYRSRNCINSRDGSSDENSGRIKLYSNVDIYPDSSVSGDSSHEIFKMGHIICEHYHTCSYHHNHHHHHAHHHHHKKKRGCNHYPINSDDESSSSISIKKSPLVLQNSKELRRLPSSERDEIIRKMLGDSTGRALVPSVWTTSTSCNTSIHKSHKNCTSWIQRDSSSGEKSSSGNTNNNTSLNNHINHTSSSTNNFSNNANANNNNFKNNYNGNGVEVLNCKCHCCKRCCKRKIIENANYVFCSNSNSAADDTEI